MSASQKKPTFWESCQPYYLKPCKAFQRWGLWPLCNVNNTLDFCVTEPDIMEYDIFYSHRTEYNEIWHNSIHTEPNTMDYGALYWVHSNICCTVSKYSYWFLFRFLESSSWCCIRHSRSRSYWSWWVFLPEKDRPTVSWILHISLHHHSQLNFFLLLPSLTCRITALFSIDNTFNILILGRQVFGALFPNIRDGIISTEMFVLFLPWLYILNNYVILNNNNNLVFLNPVSTHHNHK